jgi:hypothetical protein
MNEKKRLEFQQKLIQRQSEQIEDLKLQVENLKLEIEEKDKIISSVSSLRNELTENVKESKKYKEEYIKLIQELRKMKEIVNQEVYKGRWWLVRFLIK